jgi:hypothetical protein
MALSGASASVCAAQGDKQKDIRKAAKHKNARARTKNKPLSPLDAKS